MNRKIKVRAKWYYMERKNMDALRKKSLIPKDPFSIFLKDYWDFLCVENASEY